MYRSFSTTWTKERFVSTAASVLINLGIAATFVGLTSGGAKKLDPRPALTVIALGTGHSDNDSDAEAKTAAAASPPSPSAEQQESKQHKMEASRIVLHHQAEQSADTDEDASEQVQEIDLALTSAMPPATQVFAPAPPHRTETATAQGAAEAGEDENAARSSAAGNGVAAKYAAAVRRHLMRHRRHNTVGAGSAYVHFTVQANGHCRNVEIARSSGSSQFDRAAIQMVRRAVPFPRPPEGLSRSFNFEITGT
ncbi:hypothetical protein GCM10011349_42550 [Novosphingobium indicum]|uniref:TonB C-terminal domain-containing protein n=1 Tax=Novosphingobium indicum TaxID=462949 RepID=A0ABQ2JXW5_9SPHN|nr:energy transducer TonB [Novosphingobium indicum]GGN60678.1 hypothetical protein GCM10011349_42550 [Novosphingobium indicum]